VQRAHERDVARQAAKAEAKALRRAEKEAAGTSVKGCLSVCLSVCDVCDVVVCTGSSTQTRDRRAEMVEMLHVQELLCMSGMLGFMGGKTRGQDI